MTEIEKLAAELATAITGVPADASRDRLPEESMWDCNARRRRIDQRTKIEGLLVSFGRACVKTAKEGSKS